MAGSLDGSLDDIHSMLVSMALEQEQRGLRHYAGVTWLNIADLERARGQGAAALGAASKAIDALMATSAGLEVESARTSRAWALAHQGRWEESVREMAIAESTTFEAVRAEVYADIASIHASYGSRTIAESFVERALASPHASEVVLDVARLTQAELALRNDDVNRAAECLDRIAVDRPHPCFGFSTRVKLARAMCSIASGSRDADRDAAATSHLAARQGARLYGLSARILRGALTGRDELDSAVQVVSAEDRSALSMVAEPLVIRLGPMGLDAREMVEQEAMRRPTRWREPLRRNLGIEDRRARFAIASILDKVGETEDVGRLRVVARSLRGLVGASSLGRGLARRLAARIFVDDQGRVAINVGQDTIHGSDIRRKVLALICFLLSRASMSATRDQVLDALWPDLEPDLAANSLNQTIYFLRRVFEPSFSEDISPAYVHHNSDLVWLDPELVTSRSIKSRAAIRAAEVDPSPDNVGALSDLYRGRFALDFAYEEWAVPYRDSMHSAYLEIVEKAVIADTNGGDFDRAIGLARRAIEIDPDAEQVELSLLKLYRRTGAHAAAAEQYVHYAAVLKNDLGIDPPPLESL